MLPSRDFVFRQGEPALNFYSVEKGTLDVVRTNDDGSEQLVAVIGPGTSSEDGAHRARPQRERAGTNAGRSHRTRCAGIFSHLPGAGAAAAAAGGSDPPTHDKSVDADAACPCHAERRAGVVVRRGRHFIRSVPTACSNALEIFAEHHADTVYIVDDAGLGEGPGQVSA